MSKKELDLYLCGNMEDIGRFFLKGQLSNNHRYKRGEKYVHMFRRIKDIKFIEYNRDFEYLAKFNIPLITLMTSYGRGLYKCDMDSKYKYKYINDFKYKYVNEFAINIKKMKPEYFIGFEKLNKNTEKLKNVYKLSDQSKQDSCVI